MMFHTMILLKKNISLKNFRGRPFHIYLPVVLIGIVQSSPQHMNRNFHFLPAIPIAHSGYCRGAASGSTGNGFSGSSLPNPHVQRMIVHHLDKFRIDPIRKQGVILKEGTDLFQVDLPRILHKYNAMGIPHGYTGNGIRGILHHDFPVNNFLPLQLYRDLLRL